MTQITTQANRGSLQPLQRRHRLRVIIPAFPAFNIYSAIARRTTALGPLYVATVASHIPGWNVEVIDENNYHTGPKDGSGRPDHDLLQKMRPADFVGFYGGLTSTIPRLYELATFYKSQGVTTIGGGQHFVSENIDASLDAGVDYIVRGEGEEAIAELLTALTEGHSLDDIRGLSFRRDDETIQTEDRPPMTNFDRMPLPDFSLVRYARVKLYPLSWVRGCGMNCEFCTVKGKARCPAPEYVLEQVTALHENHNAHNFFLVDDLFGQDREGTLKLCRMLERYQEASGARLNLTVQIRLDKSRDDELLAAMRPAGIHTVAIGFESPIAEELKAMRKSMRPEDMLEMTRKYHRAGFFVHGMFMFGYPLPEGSRVEIPTKERIKRFRDFIRKARIDTVQILLPVPLPGTEMTRRLEEENRVLPRSHVGWEYYDGNFPVFLPDKPLTPEELQSAVWHVTGRFYRFRHVFLIAFNVLSFPAMILPLFNVKVGWRKWRRSWRNELLRFGGWIILRKWTQAFRKSGFPSKLAGAKQTLSSR